MGIFPQLLANGIAAGSTYALVAIGFGLIYATTRFFHFAHGAVYAAAAYAAYAGVSIFHLPLVPAVGVAVIFAACFGVLMEIGVYRPLRQRGTGPASLLLASLGLFIVFENAIPMLFGAETRVLYPISNFSFTVAGALITPIQVVIVATSVAACFAVWAFLRFTPTGRATRAIADDAELCRIKGIHVERTIVITFALGSGLAGIAAILAALDTDMRPAMGFDALLMGVVAAVVGGVGSIPGAFLGGLLLGLALNLGVWKLSTGWQDAIAFCLLILFLVVKPQGFFGLPLRRTSV